ncbi:hypothetical protein BSM4216_2692 [Bacillus smithii]|nr:hypothetical protein BSM4216_2692 [Bacillus smithii]
MEQSFSYFLNHPARIYQFYCQRKYNEIKERIGSFIMYVIWTLFFGLLAIGTILILVGKI